MGCDRVGVPVTPVLSPFIGDCGGKCQGGDHCNVIYVICVVMGVIVLAKLQHDLLLVTQFNKVGMFLCINPEYTSVIKAVSMYCFVFYILTQY